MIGNVFLSNLIFNLPFLDHNSKRYKMFKFSLFPKRENIPRQAGQAGVQAGHIGRATNREAPATGPAHMAGPQPERPRPRGRSGRGAGRARGTAPCGEESAANDGGEGKREARGEAKRGVELTPSS